MFDDDKAKGRKKKGGVVMMRMRDAFDNDWVLMPLNASDDDHAMVVDIMKCD